MPANGHVSVFLLSFPPSSVFSLQRVDLDRIVLIPRILARRYVHSRATFAFLLKAIEFSDNTLPVDLLGSCSDFTWRRCRLIIQAAYRSCEGGYSFVAANLAVQRLEGYCVESPLDRYQAKLVC
jgi:hypothetical protein